MIIEVINRATGEKLSAQELLDLVNARGSEGEQEDDEFKWCHYDMTDWLEHPIDILEWLRDDDVIVRGAIS